MKSKLELDPKRLYAAIERGVQSAFWQLMTNATGTPCREFYDAVGDAVERSMTAAMTAGDQDETTGPAPPDTAWNEIDDL